MGDKACLGIEIDNRDTEIDCMSCLVQVITHYEQRMDQDELDRISVWFKDRYYEGDDSA